MIRTKRKKISSIYKSLYILLLKLLSEVCSDNSQSSKKELLWKSSCLKDIALAEIDVYNINFLPLPLASGLSLHTYEWPLLYKLNSTLFKMSVLRHSIMTFPSITFKWLVIASYFKYYEFFSNLSTCVLVGFGCTTGFEPRFDKIYKVRVWLKSNNVFIQHLMVF